MSKLISRVVIYSLLLLPILYSLPNHGEVKESNFISSALWLRGDKLAVTMPWQGVLIKSGITGSLRVEILKHEQCHVDQIKKIGWFDFMVEYHNNGIIFESECYKLEKGK